MIRLRCGCAQFRFVRDHDKARRLVTAACEECGVVPVWQGEVPEEVVRAMTRDPAATAADYVLATAYMEELRREMADGGPPAPPGGEPSASAGPEGAGRLAGWGLGHGLYSAHDLPPGELVPFLVSAPAGKVHLERLIRPDPERALEASPRDPVVLVVDATLDGDRVLLASIRAGGLSAHAAIPYSWTGTRRELGKIRLEVPAPWEPQAQAIAAAVSKGLDEHGDGARIYDQAQR